MGLLMMENGFKAEWKEMENIYGKMEVIMKAPIQVEKGMDLAKCSLKNKIKHMNMMECGMMEIQN